MNLQKRVSSICHLFAGMVKRIPFYKKVLMMISFVKMNLKC